jgi:alkanesulfonate monooxygenase SsuD/methylene tetrahydromethanopterin reductase-like flavin-dependent oxidoreductase (luciferase family)
MNERHWEALDLIIKAWTAHDGPVSHEGRFFHHRMINIWPRAYQQPHPPIWVSTTSPSGAARVGSRGFVQATFLTGFDGTRAVFDAYRRGWREAGRGDVVPLDRLAYAALVYTAPSEAQARAGAEKLMWYITANKIVPHFTYPPGYVPVRTAVDVLRGRTSALSHFGETPSVENAIKAGVMMAGTADQVMKQIRKIYDYVGGFGHILLMGQAGFLDHQDTVLGIKTFAREVYPHLKEGFAAAPTDAAVERQAVPAAGRQL